MSTEKHVPGCGGDENGGFLSGDFLYIPAFCCPVWSFIDDNFGRMMLKIVTFMAAGPVCLNGMCM